MYGKIFESMYEGSMYGAGTAVFAVWPWVIAHAYDSRVEINPKRLADTLGATVDEVEKAIAFLSSPDPQSRWKEHDGRRLLKEGEFQYFVPSWEHYRKIRDNDARREYNRVAQAKWREEQKARPRRKTQKQVRAENEAREERFCRAETEEERAAIAAEGL
jgi:hypothetical protein